MNMVTVIIFFVLNCVVCWQNFFITPQFYNYFIGNPMTADVLSTNLQEMPLMMYIKNSQEIRSVFKSSYRKQHHEKFAKEKSKPTEPPSKPTRPPSTPTKPPSTPTKPPSTPTKPPSKSTGQPSNLNKQSSESNNAVSKPIQDLYEYFKTLRAKHPQLASRGKIEDSLNNHNITVFKVSVGGVGKKAVILIIGDSERAECGSTEVMRYWIEQLVENPVNSYLLAEADWIFLPTLNPDSDQSDSFKTKNSSATFTKCLGIYLGKKANKNCVAQTECKEVFTKHKDYFEKIYGGMSDFFDNIYPVNILINVKESGHSLEYPSESTGKFINDSSDLSYLATNVNFAMTKYGGSNYTVKGVNTSCSLLQWGRNLGVKYSFNFNLPEKKIKPNKERLLVGQETFVGLREFHRVITAIYSLASQLLRN